MARPGGRAGRRSSSANSLQESEGRDGDGRLRRASQRVASTTADRRGWGPCSKQSTRVILTHLQLLLSDKCAFGPVDPRD